MTRGESIDLSYDALDRLTQACTKAYAYEDNGNQTSVGNPDIHVLSTKRPTASPFSG